MKNLISVKNNLNNNLPFPAVFNLSTLNGTNGFKINGVKFGYSPQNALSSGDINGDGIMDVIIGSPRALDYTGQSYVVFGSRNSFPSEMLLKELNGINGFKIDGINKDDWSGYAVSSGDINGDGITDVIIGAWEALNKAGQSYVVFGSRNTFPGSILLSALNGTNGFKINGINDGDYSGSALSSGDINGDGITDVIIGAWFALNWIGQSYVVFGSKIPFSDTIFLKDLNGTNGFKIDVVKRNHRSEFALSSGDINGDGIADVIIGAYYALDCAGQSYVVFGSRNSFSSTILLTELNGINGFKIDGITVGDQSGFALSSGDINGDGIADVIIGAWWALNSIAGSCDAFINKDGAGQSYVVFGSRNSFPPRVFLSELDGTNGFKINGIDPWSYSGSAVSSGDINGDLIADVIIGVPHQAGQSYVVFGSRSPFPDTILLNNINGTNGFRINGINPGDESGRAVSSGDINGDGITDVIVGAYYGFNGTGQSYVVFGKNSGLPFCSDASFTGNPKYAAEIGLSAYTNTLDIKLYSLPSSGSLHNGSVPAIVNRTYRANTLQYQAGRSNGSYVFSYTASNKMGESNKCYATINVASICNCSHASFTVSASSRKEVNFTSYVNTLDIKLYSLPIFGILLNVSAPAVINASYAANALQYQSGNDLSNVEFTYAATSKWQDCVQCTADITVLPACSNASFTINTGATEWIDFAKYIIGSLNITLHSLPDYGILLYNNVRAKVGEIYGINTLKYQAIDNVIDANFSYSAVADQSKESSTCTVDIHTTLPLPPSSSSSAFYEQPYGIAAITSGAALIAGVVGLTIYSKMKAIWCFTHHDESPLHGVLMQDCGSTDT